VWEGEEVTINSLQIWQLGFVEEREGTGGFWRAWQERPVKYRSKKMDPARDSGCGVSRPFLWTLM
jgi:hypothetical protein